MTGTLFPVNSDATGLQQLTEYRCSKLSWILDGEILVCTRIIERHIAPQSQDRGPGLTINENLAASAGGRGDDAIVNAVVIRKRCDADEGTVARTISWKNAHENYIVIDGESRNRGTVIPHQIILAPTFAIAFEGEIGVIGHDVAVNILDAFLH